MQGATTKTEPKSAQPISDADVQPASQEPQIRQRERSGILGEPAGLPPGSEGKSDGTGRSDPIQEQVPQDGADHWRR